MTTASDPVRIDVLNREPLSQEQLTSLTKRLAVHYDVQAVVIMAVTQQGGLLRCAFECAEQIIPEVPMLLRRTADEIDGRHPRAPGRPLA